jgi:hypothetical protein
MEEAALEQQRPGAEDEHQALEGIAQIVRHPPALVKHEADYGITGFAASTLTSVMNNRFYQRANYSIIRPDHDRLRVRLGDILHSSHEARLP